MGRDLVEVCFSKCPQCFLCLGVNWAVLVGLWPSLRLGFFPALSLPYFFFFYYHFPALGSSISDWPKLATRLTLPYTPDLQYWDPVHAHTCFTQSWGPNSGSPVPAQFLTLSIHMPGTQTECGFLSASVACIQLKKDE